MTQANHPAFVRLSSLGVTTVTGKDALAFLHGQFTNRLQPLGQRAPLAGYCSPKGRLLATMRVWGEGDAISLLLPKSVEPAFLKRIRMYVLRSDVHFAEDAERTLLAGFGEEAETLLKDRLAAAGGELPAVNEASVTPDLTVVRVPDSPDLPGVARAGVRYLVLAKDPHAFSPAEDDSYWWATEAAAGIGSVFAATADRFVPQSINYELTDGVVFNKGCYPGQEVVSGLLPRPGSGLAHPAHRNACAPHGPGPRRNGRAPRSGRGRLRPEGRSPHALGRPGLRREGRRSRRGTRLDSDGRLRARIVARRGRRDPRQARAASLRNPQRARQLRGAFSALQLGDVLREGVPFFSPYSLRARNFSPSDPLGRVLFFPSLQDPKHGVSETGIRFHPTSFLTFA